MLCRVCGRSVKKSELVEIGDGCFCTDCLGGRFGEAKKGKDHEFIEFLDGEPDDQRSSLVNAIFFFIIGLPILLSFFGFPNYLLGFLDMVHEMGHFIVMLMDLVLPGDNWFLVVLAGSGFEFLLPFASFLFTYPDRRIFVVSCLFLSASGTAMIDAANYMASSQNPYGTAFISGKPVTYENHDWHLIFAQLDILDKSTDISHFFATLGYIMEYTGFFTALCALFSACAHKPKDTVFIYGIILSMVLTAFRAEYDLTFILFLCGLFLVAFQYLTKE